MDAPQGRFCALVSLIHTIQSERRQLLTEATSNWHTQLSQVQQLNANQELATVTLDIGGTYFTSTVDTLCGSTVQNPDHMLFGMFGNGMFGYEIEADGTVFLDRDGTSFALILDWLRGTLDTADTDLFEIMNLAELHEFYRQSTWFGLAHLSSAVLNAIQHKTNPIVWFDYTHEMQAVDTLETDDYPYPSPRWNRAHFYPRVPYKPQILQGGFCCACSSAVSTCCRGLENFHLELLTAFPYGNIVCGFVLEKGGVDHSKQVMVDSCWIVGCLQLEEGYDGGEYPADPQGAHLISFGRKFARAEFRWTVGTVFGCHLGVESGKVREVWFTMDGRLLGKRKPLITPIPIGEILPFVAGVDGTEDQIRTVSPALC
eukprot:TRINITY_DN13374_c0_g1_i1.p1 TRINITY_DN13374_c0_g1~~TRINITY_DN13374_c0_g1_i1.p1  ORF type:complete len:372 (+),score=5.68 TRINITY_DN13374_c0_g1_i1:37-1152(+)